MSEEATAPKSKMEQLKDWFDGPHLVTVEQYNASTQIFFEKVKEEIEKQARAQVHEQVVALAASVLPSLREPAATMYQIRGTDGVFRTAGEDVNGLSIQDVIELNGKGREMQIVLRWSGANQDA